jgi:signal transduction histidine kinase
VFFAAVAACLSVLFILRLRQIGVQVCRELEQRFNARVEERTQFARDLHDSLLQEFQGLMFRLQAVRQLLPARGSEAAVLLDTALDAGDKAMAEGRDALRDLREPSLIQGDMSETLAALGKEFSDTCAAQCPSYGVFVEGKPQPLDPLVRDEVYRIAREAIGKAFKYAGAGKIEAELVYGSAQFCIRVRHDGVGKIELKVPAHTAYVPVRRPWRLPGPWSAR